MKALFTLLLLFTIIYSGPGFSQHNQTTDETERSQGEIREAEIPVKLLPYSNPLTETRDDIDFRRTPLSLDDMDKELLQRISDAYRIHILAMDAQIQDDLIQAEEYITDALAAMQALMDDYPEIQNNRRFAELYRSIMAEHNEFYGITEPVNGVEGDIFAIQEELFAEQDDWIAEGYVLPDNLSFNQTDVPLIHNQHVNNQLMYFTVRRPEVMERWLERSEIWFPMMLEIFTEEGVPTELIHLSMIESGLVPTARSWAGAVGLWQFIRATGGMYGLDVNWWVDERRDPVKSTRAAARHLRDLYDIWGDWHLAMANYNLSPRGLRRAIRSAGGVEDYWVAYPYLPRETRGYVPSYIATTMIAMNPEKFGFQRNTNSSAFSYDVVEVDGLMPLEDLADAAGISTQELKEYNPELLRWATPPGDDYQLRIPSGIRDEFMAAYQEIPEENRAQNIAQHTVNRGENLGFIARRYGITVRALYEANEGLSSLIHPGQTIIVPVAPGSSGQIAENRASSGSQTQPGQSSRSSSSSGNNSSGSSSSSTSSSQQVQAPPNTNSLTYTVKSGDTIGHIAEWYDVRAWQIRAWNGIQNTIRVGQRLTIHVPANRRAFYEQINNLAFAQKQDLQRRQRAGENIYDLQLDGSGTSPDGTVTYTVRRNETLGGIANRHGVTVEAIQRENNLSGTRIHAGQTLTIPRR